jgi:acyl carrier protein
MDSKQKIRAFIVDNFYVPETASLADDTPLIESGIVDSTGVLEVVAFLEETFKITIPDQDMLPANLDTIARMANYVTRMRNKPADLGTHDALLHA